MVELRLLCNALFQNVLLLKFQNGSFYWLEVKARTIIQGENNNEH